MCLQCGLLVIAKLVRMWMLNFDNMFHGSARFGQNLSVCIATGLRWPPSTIIANKSVAKNVPTNSHRHLMGDWNQIGWGELIDHPKHVPAKRWQLPGVLP